MNGSYLNLILGGERGIRTLDASCDTYTLSKRAPSATRAPLQKLDSLVVKLRLMGSSLGPSVATFRGPSTSRMKTSFQRKVALQTAAGCSHLQPLGHLSSSARAIKLEPTSEKTSLLLLGTKLNTSLPLKIVNSYGLVYNFCFNTKYKASIKIVAKTPCTSLVKYVQFNIRMPLIEVNDVSKLFGFGDATTVALDEVNFNVEKGEFVAIMGPSGSGKTTLMNTIGLLDHPTHGTYKLNGRLSTKLGRTKRAKLRRDTIGFVFQSANLLSRLTVIDNVALPLAYKGMAPVRRLKRASEILERVGLADREYYYPRQLSGGQIQRAAIARALVNNPSIIIADEPTGNLDSLSSRVVMELLSEIHQSGNTILMVTHNPELTRYANRVVYMHDGAIIHDKPSAIGEVPRAIRKTMYFAPRTTEEDNLAGVSALMKIIPGGDTEKVDTKNGKRKVAKKPRAKRAKKKVSSK